MYQSVGIVGFMSYESQDWQGIGLACQSQSPRFPPVGLFSFWDPAAPIRVAVLQLVQRGGQQHLDLEIPWIRVPLSPQHLQQILLRRRGFLRTGAGISCGRIAGGKTSGIHNPFNFLEDIPGCLPGAF